MSKESIKRFPSLRNNIVLPDKKDSQEPDHKLSDPQLKLSTQESELSKKIQNKFKMRKRTSNPNNHQSISHQPTQEDNVGSISSDFSSLRNIKSELSHLQYFNEDTNLNQLISRVWDRDADLIEKTMSPLINRDVLKELIMKQSGIIICQLGRGEKIEEILKEKGEQLMREQRSRRKIAEKQNKIMKMIEERINKLEKLTA